MSRTTIAVEIGPDLDVYMPEATRLGQPPSLVLQTGPTQLVLTLTTDAIATDTFNRIGEALADWRTSLSEPMRCRT